MMDGRGQSGGFFGVEAEEAGSEVYVKVAVMG